MPAQVLAIAALASCLSPHAIAVRDPGSAAVDTLAERYPGHDWHMLSHAEMAGWSPSRLAAARVYADSIGSAAVMIVEQGTIVARWGETSRRFDSHSIRKSLLSALYGIYAAEGRINLRATLAELGIDDNAPSLTGDEKQATIVDLLGARSGVYHVALYESPRMQANRPARYSHPPGSFWYYNNWDFNALGTIFTQMTGLAIGEAFAEQIARPLAMEDFRVKDVSYVRGEESNHSAYPFRISARDLTRFGLLYLRRGRWQDKQIVPEDWVAKSTHSRECLGDFGGYGYLWWVEVNGRHLPGVDLGGGAFSARGFRGHHVLVIPAYDMVVVHRVDTDKPTGAVSNEQFGRLLRLVLDAKRG